MVNNSLEVVDERVVLGKIFRIYGDFNNPLFLAKDVAEWIEHSNVTVMLTSVDEEEKVKLNNAYFENRTGGNGTMFLTEDGLYEVLMQSRKPIAKEFKKKVKEILKQIRQTGGYIPIQQEDSEAEILSKALLIAQKTLEKKDILLAQREQQLIEQAPKVEYHDKVLNTRNLLKITDIAKDLGTSAQLLNKYLNMAGVIYKKGITWYVYAEYEYLITDGFCDYHISEYGQQLKWTEKGRKFILEMVNENKSLLDRKLTKKDAE